MHDGDNCLYLMHLSKLLFKTTLKFDLLIAKMLQLPGDFVHPTPTGASPWTHSLGDFRPLGFLTQHFRPSFCQYVS